LAEDADRRSRIPQTERVGLLAQDAALAGTERAGVEQLACLGLEERALLLVGEARPELGADGFEDRTRERFELVDVDAYASTSSSAWSMTVRSAAFSWSSRPAVSAFVSVRLVGAPESSWPLSVRTPNRTDRSRGSNSGNRRRISPSTLIASVRVSSAHSSRVFCRRATNSGSSIQYAMVVRGMPDSSAAAATELTVAAITAVAFCRCVYRRRSAIRRR